MPIDHQAPATEADLEPLLTTLLADRAVTEPTYFPRGCLLPDGRLDLCKQALGPERAQAVTEALRHNTFVRNLLVGADFIGDEGAQSIARLLAAGAPLETVFVGCNLIGPRGAEGLALASADSAVLRGLWLKRNPIGHRGVLAVARLLQTSSSLRTLDLVQTDLSAGDLALITRAASASPSLERIYLGGNGLRDMSPIATMLAESPRLEGLFLGGQPLGDLGARLIAQALPRSRSLRVLALPSAGLSPAGVAALAEAAAAHPTLQSFSVGLAPAQRVLGAELNAVGDHGARAIAALIRTSRTLRSLDLAGDHLGAPELSKILDALEDNQQLAELRIHHSAPELGVRLKRLLERNRVSGAAVARHPDVQAISSVYRTKAGRGPLTAVPRGSGPPRILPELPSQSEVEAASSLLERLAAAPELFFEHPQALKGLRASANRVVSGIIEVARDRKRLHRPPPKDPKEVRQAQQERDRSLIARTGLRQQRSGQARSPLTGDENLAGSKACYVCKQPYQRVHPHYDALCVRCGDDNYARRSLTGDLSGRTALLTGGRLKIGRQIALKLLRSGASVLITTRFPHDAAQRYSSEPGFETWGPRLKIIGLDLRHLPSVEALAAELAGQLGGLDILINNAAQTIRRPAGFYQHLLAAEEQALPSGLGSLILSATHAPPPFSLSPSIEHFPPGIFEDDGQQLDLRAQNSWSLSVGEISTLELLEVHVVNCLAPFILVRGLLPALERSPHPRRFIVNVSAMEGSFSRAYKSEAHPHTNMAKASLNMLTRTAASGLAKKGVFMNSVDTGWITNEQPFPVRERMKAEYGFTAPLDEIDGASRVLDPVFRGLTAETPSSGLFFKDYRPVEW